MTSQHFHAFMQMVRTADPEAEYEEGSGVLKIHSWHSGAFGKPVLVDVTPAAVDRFVDSMDSDSRDALWPDVDLATAGRRLLSVNLEEMVMTRGVDQGLRLKITESGVDSTGSEQEVSTDVTPGGAWFVDSKNGPVQISREGTDEA
ncbi:hypothetical protein LWF01_14180 [Saxibacter everestensis]|uniref:Uncharacterized protein n=1 Tax=Saxibacter everestensis TaxID=2909229 RepID=A0ABY8QQG4_9MICO|nr:hypothetical protein LWF01_14180 [Brevibacteriaceae bacterium ZFBP1038]